ncbi:transcriptional regulator, XRE family with cupin sensor [Verrucomicrobium sp. GAS474]|uniref:cupin domain-containing protein n=1 Tax=Verrucomicrobium sp. GAS474 TaxID=1882831 RepID=UPI00087DD842|nr:cupin domain-containing protein [Verrucomicrobium sp. GAS474]SDU29522.1 transcriptional regulator, XRE family with cupin sensor [Verrucomicrobium sp. GAS474]
MDEHMVGKNIRALRLASKASLTEVAARAGITKSTLSKIETGQTSSPISTLVSIATAMGVRLAEFFREAEEPSRHTLTRKGKGKIAVRDGSRFGYTYEALAIGFPNKPVEPFLLTISPGDKEGNFRHGGHEFIYLLSGDIEITLDGEPFELHAGDSLYFDPTQDHALRLLNKKPARFLCFFIETP